jgi:GntR family transcriptional regulator
MPSEAQLMDHFAVARMTVRQAMQVLRGEGLVVAEHGRGVFVREHPPVRRLAADRFARANRERGDAAFIAEATAESRAAAVDHIDVSIQTPSPAVRSLLGLNTRERVVVRDRRYLADGKPVEKAVSYIPASIARGTRIAEPDTGPGGIYARIEELGHRLGRFTEEIDARMPSPAEAASLELAAGVPVIHLVRVAFDTDDRPVEVCDTVMASDAFVLSYGFPAL